MILSYNKCIPASCQAEGFDFYVGCAETIRKQGPGPEVGRDPLPPPALRSGRPDSINAARSSRVFRRTVFEVGRQRLIRLQSITAAWARVALALGRNRPAVSPDTTPSPWARAT